MREPVYKQTSEEKVSRRVQISPLLSVPLCLVCMRPQDESLALKERRRMGEVELKTLVHSSFKIPFQAIMVTYAFNSRRQRHSDLCEFQTGLVYLASSKPVRTK